MYPGTGVSARCEGFLKTLSCECCILGAGPAGFGAGIELTRHGITDIIMIDRNQVVGGLSRTEAFGEARFDVGPHRFFTRNPEINKLWVETLGDDFRPVKRLTRIYYNNNFFNYPIKPLETFRKLGPVDSLHVLTSFAFQKVKRKTEARTFEEWVVQKFGRKLYQTFFKTYTEKVWGIPCSEIGSEWAAQRIRGLDIFQLLKKSIRFSGNDVKSLVDEFHYPVLGAGQMYEVMAETLTAQGVRISLGTRVVSINRRNATVDSVDVEGPAGDLMRISAGHFFNSVPVTHFFKMFNPPEEERVLSAAEALYYREHITVNVLVEGRDIFPDQWIYIHSPEVRMARLANYNNFSEDMVLNKNKTALSIEYFVFQDDELWKKGDQEVAKLALQELQQLRLLDTGRVEQTWVVRETESYPTYYLGFQQPYEVLKTRSGELSNVSAIGRGGMYKYNNQDHSTYSGLLAARNYLHLPGTPYNLWAINSEAEYHER
jgi:protoporphyrinogen oxidase